MKPCRYRYRLLVFALWIGTTLILTSCTGSSTVGGTASASSTSHAGSTPANQPTNSAALPADPCTLASASDVGAAFGTPMNPPTEFPDRSGGASCNYIAVGHADEGVAIGFDPAAESQPIRDALKQAAMQKGTYQPINGLGDEAFFDGVNLAVVKGGVAFVIGGAAFSGNAALGGSTWALAWERKLATTILTHI